MRSVRRGLYCAHGRHGGGRRREASRRRAAPDGGRRLRALAPGAAAARRGRIRGRLHAGARARRVQRAAASAYPAVPTNLTEATMRLTGWTTRAAMLLLLAASTPSPA